MDGHCRFRTTCCQVDKHTLVYERLSQAGWRYSYHSTTPTNDTHSTIHHTDEFFGYDSPNELQRFKMGLLLIGHFGPAIGLALGDTIVWCMIDDVWCCWSMGIEYCESIHSFIIYCCSSPVQLVKVYLSNITMVCHGQSIDCFYHACLSLVNISIYLFYSTLIA